MKHVTLSGNLPKRNSFALFVDRNRNTIVEVISALFILLFVYTGINKFIALNTLQYVLKEYPLIGNFPTAVAWGLPLIELFVAALLFIPKTRLRGLYASLILMTGFTAYLSYMLVFTPKLPCTCGGLLQKLSWPQHLIFNILFVLLSIIAIRLRRRNNDQSRNTEAPAVIFT
jgi:hypothetical protein